MSEGGYFHKDELFLIVSCRKGLPLSGHGVCYLTPPSASKHIQMKIKPLYEEPELSDLRTGTGCYRLPAHGGKAEKYLIQFSTDFLACLEGGWA